MQLTVGKNVETLTNGKVEDIREVINNMQKIEVYMDGILVYGGMGDEFLKMFCEDK